MDIQKISVIKLNSARYNPRKSLKPGDAEYEKLKNSIETFGFVEPVIWNKRTGNIVGGHQRYTVLKDLGYSEIDCVVVDLHVNDEKALNIALNKVSGLWDDVLLKDLLLELDNGAYDLNLTGFDTKEIESLMTQFHIDTPELISNDAVGTSDSNNKTNNSHVFTIQFLRYIFFTNKDEKQEFMYEFFNEAINKDDEYKEKLNNKIIDAVIEVIGEIQSEY